MPCSACSPSARTRCPSTTTAHLHYWLVTPAGAIAADREVRLVQPLHYPEEGSGSLGFERTYYDAVWTGASFFVSYGSESLSGPPLSVYYETIDLAGNVLRAEAAAFDTTVAIGPVLATNGTSVALVALRSVALTGNYVYLRFFAADGTPLGVETLISPLEGPLGTPPLPYGPTVSWDGNEFVAVYAESAFPELAYQLVFQHFGAERRGHAGALSAAQHRGRGRARSDPGDRDRPPDGGLGRASARQDADVELHHQRAGPLRAARADRRSGRGDRGAARRCA